MQRAQPDDGARYAGLRSDPLIRKPRVPVTSGTFPTDTALFYGLVLGVILIVAGLTFFPVLAMGPPLGVRDRPRRFARRRRPDRDRLPDPARLP